MSGKIQVVLLEDVESLGRAGEVVSVSEGYARNALFPEGKAALATPAVQRLQVEKAAAQQQAEKKKLTELQAIASKLDGTELTITVRSQDDGKIFGSITARQIADELNRQANLAVKAGAITSPGPIHNIGTYPVTVRLSPEIDFVIQLVITAQPDETNSAAEEEIE